MNELVEYWMEKTASKWMRRLMGKIDSGDISKEMLAKTLKNEQDKANKIYKSFPEDVKKMTDEEYKLSSRASTKSMIAEGLQEKLKRNRPVLSLQELESGLVGITDKNYHSGLKKHKDKHQEAVEALMEGRQIKRPILAKVPTDKFSGHKFSPHLAETDEAKRMQGTVKALSGDSDPLWNKNEWGKRPFYETVIKPEHISPKSRAKFEYYIPSAKGIPAKDLIKDPTRFVYKGGFPDSIQSLKTGLGSGGEGVFASGYPEVAGGYAMSRAGQNFRKANYRDLRNYLKPIDLRAMAENSSKAAMGYNNILNPKPVNFAR